MQPSSEYMINHLNKDHINAYAGQHREYYSRSGFYQHAAEHCVRRSCQTFYLIMLCVGGKGRYYCKDKEYAIEDGDLMVCYPGMQIEYESDPVFPWSLYWIHFDLAQNSPMTALLDSPEVNPNHPVTRMINKFEFIELFEKLLQYRDVSEDETLFAMNQSLFHALVYLTLHRFRHADDQKSYVYQAIEYIDSHLNQKISLDDLSAYINLSKYHLARLLAEDLHMTPSRYITAKRMERARTLLAASSLSIGDIAAQTGFETSMYFSNVFKKETGISPSQYRRQTQL